MALRNHDDEIAGELIVLSSDNSCDGISLIILRYFNYFLVRRERSLFRAQNSNQTNGPHRRL